MSLLRRLELLLFSLVWVTYGWFYQGGGWNQNARFAEVRAIAEQGRFTVDDYLVYTVGDAFGHLQRHPVRAGEVELHGRTRRLAWTDANWNLTSVTGVPPQEPMVLVPLEEMTSTGDVSFANGHFYSNKPPGTSFLATVSYAVLFRLERLLGINVDGWWALTCNAWLTTVFSVGLGSAIGAVLFFRVALHFAAGELLPALLATLTFAFGTLFFPYGTLLFDHNLTTTGLLGCYYFLLHRTVENGTPARLAARFAFLAGLCAGGAVVTNYVAVVPVGFFGVYLIATVRNRLAFLWFATGALGPLALLLFYNYVCFGSPLALNTGAQNPSFQSQSAFLGMFGLPRWDAAITLIASPFRGLFFSAPVLVLGVYGVRSMFRARIRPADAWLCTVVPLFYYLVNTSFNGYHGGYACGPRYLIPALPFLALPLVHSFRALPRLTGVLAAVSVTVQSFFTITDPQSTVGVGGLAILDGRADWKYSPLTDAALPLFFQGRAWPAIELVLADYIAKRRTQLEQFGARAPEIEQSGVALGIALRAAVMNQEAVPLLLGTVAGPVSANPVGAYEAEYHHLFAPRDAETQWNSFNVGEFLFPEKRASLLPLLVFIVAIGGGMAAVLKRNLMTPT